MNEKILKIFYEEIIPNASKTGTIIVDGIRYCVHFNTKIENQEVHITDSTIPMLTIKNIDKFNKNLIQYIEKISSIFDNPKFDSVKERVCGFEKENQIKYLLTVLFANATEEDFKNPIRYLKTQIDFMNNNQLYKKYNMYTEVANIQELDNSKIEVISTIQEPTLETPYVFSSRLVKNFSDQTQYYDLPNISYGISDDVVYIYTIKGKRKKSNQLSTNYQKKINRKLYKINKDVIPSIEYVDYKEGKSSFYPENIIDITHSSVLALTLFLAILKKENYHKIVVVDYLPLRYSSRHESKMLKLNKEDISDDNEYSKVKNNIEEELDYYQSNITSKFIRTFERVNHHLENMDIISYPGEIDNVMHIKLNDNVNNNDHIINHIYNTIVNAHKKESRK